MPRIGVYTRTDTHTLNLTRPIVDWAANLIHEQFNEGYMATKDKLLALLKTFGIELGDKAKDIEKGLDEIDKSLSATPAPSTAAAPAAGDPVLKAQVDALNQKVSDLMDALTDERKQRETSRKALEDQAKADAAKKVDALIDKHLKAGQIIPAMKDQFKKMLEADFDTGLKIIEALPVDPAAKKAADATANKTGGDEGDGKKTAPTAAVGLEGMAGNDVMKGIREMSQPINN